MPTGMPSLLRNIMQSLVSIDFHGSHTRDRFCTICLRAFSSERCLDHSMHHPVAEQPNVYVLHVIRRDGWLLIPYQQLPSDMIIGIRKIQCNLRPTLVRETHKDINIEVSVQMRKTEKSETRLFPYNAEGISGHESLCWNWMPASGKSGDDTIFLIDDNLEHAKNLKYILCLFEQLAGLKINNIFTCNVVDLPLKYLDIPIDQKRILNKDWKVAENKMEHKLGCWPGVKDRMDYFRKRFLWQEDQEAGSNKEAGGASRRRSVACGGGSADDHGSVA
uniref:Uncharacterized protein n=1 Tax=Oryza sativa subsp. japonica TaxID=39947 RepID=Q33AW0_ORYSJ|nr:hypothetical protein LOC_Os10g07370 [Oryza sativa Japonica Group]